MSTIYATRVSNRSNKSSVELYLETKQEQEAYIKAVKHTVSLLTNDSCKVHTVYDCNSVDIVITSKPK